MSAPDVPEAARAYIASAPTAANAELLRALDDAALSALIDALTRDGRRAHLEAIGRTTLPRALRKIAKKAAYALKSRGVTGRAAPRPKPALDPDAEDLTCAAGATPPGLTGLYFLLLRTLRGPSGTVPGVQVRAEHQGEIVEAEALPSLSAAGLRGALKLASAAEVPGLPFVASADLAVRLIDNLAEVTRLRGDGFPPAWPYVLAWRDAALALGADPARAHARRALAAELAAMETAGPAATAASAALADAPMAGPKSPASHVVAALLDHAPEVIASLAGASEGRVRAEVVALAHAHGDRWLADGQTRPLVAAFLEATADTLLARGERAHAVAALAAADRVRGGASVADVPLLAKAFEALVDDDSLVDPLAC